MNTGIRGHVGGQTVRHMPGWLQSLSSCRRCEVYCGERFFRGTCELALLSHSALRTSTSQLPSPPRCLTQQWHTPPTQAPRPLHSLIHHSRICAHSGDEGSCQAAMHDEAHGELCPAL